MAQYGTRSLTAGESAAVSALIYAIDNLPPVLTCSTRTPLYSHHASELESRLEALIKTLTAIQQRHEPFAEPSTPPAAEYGPAPMPSYTSVGHSADEMPF